MKFMDKSCEFADIVAFILPRSFKKYTFMNRINDNYHLISEFDCDSFRTPENNPVSIKCVFQIWKKECFKRNITVLDTENSDFEMRHYHFSKTSKEDMDAAKDYYDFAIAQVGSNFKPKDTKDINSGSYWFIKSNTDKNLKELFSQLDYSFLDGMNTVFKSLSKKDIILAYKNKINEL